MKKSKIISMILATALAISTLAGCGNTGSNKMNSSTGTGQKEDMPNIVVTFAYLEIPKSIDEVTAKINEITMAEIGATVTFVPWTYGQVAEQMTLNLSNPSEQIDVMFGQFRGGLSGFAGRGQLKPLDDLIDEYGTDIKDVLGGFIEGTTINGQIYGVTTVRDLATQQAYFFDKEIIDELGIELPAHIDNMSELTPIFAQLKEAHPNMYMACSSGIQPEGYRMSQTGLVDMLGDNFGVLMDMRELKVSNLYESEEYRNFVHMKKAWNQAGFVYPDIVTDQSNGGVQLIRNGVVTSYWQPYKPGVLVEQQISTGRSLYEVKMGEPFVMTRGSQNWAWVIPENAVYPELAMQFLNLLFTNEELVNTLNYGVYGENWVLNDNGFATGGPNSEGYSDKTAWKSGNALLSAVWEGDNKTVYQDLMNWNKEARMSDAYGFTFDSTSVNAEYTALSSVLAEHRMMLEWGFVNDVDVALEEFNNALYAAGLQTYMDEKQRQINEWAVNR